MAGCQERDGHGYALGRRFPKRDIKHSDSRLGQALADGAIEEAGDVLGRGHDIAEGGQVVKELAFIWTQDSPDELLQPGEFDRGGRGPRLKGNPQVDFQAPGMAVNRTALGERHSVLGIEERRQV